MKVRMDYVSNSSSSSFVLSHMDCFSFFNITKEDILNALIDAYGVKDYRSAKAKTARLMKKHPEYFEGEEKWENHGPFYVYDLMDPNDRKEAVERWGKLLSGWIANNCIKKAVRGKRGVAIDSISQDNYRHAIDGIAEIYGIGRYDLYDIAAGKSAKGCNRFIGSADKDPKTGMYGHYEPLPHELVGFVRKLRRECGIMSNLDVIRSKCARFFVHADDNEFMHGKFVESGVNDDHSWNKDVEKKDWTSEYGSFDRICEVIYRYLVKERRINPDDPAFLECMKVDDKYLTARDIQDGRLYGFMDGKRLSWEDVEMGALTWNMHEG